VVTGIRLLALAAAVVWAYKLQWGPVVVTGISRTPPPESTVGLHASMGSGRGDRNQGGILAVKGTVDEASMGSGRGDRNQHLRSPSDITTHRRGFNGVRSW